MRLKSNPALKGLEFGPVGSKSTRQAGQIKGRHGTDRVTAVSHLVSCLELDWLLIDWDGGWGRGLGVDCVSGGQVQRGATNYSDKNLF